MAEREHIQRTSRAPRDTSDKQHSRNDTASTSERAAKIRADLDDLLDEIDEVLESNAEDFVKSYVQKGGQ